MKTVYYPFMSFIISDMIILKEELTERSSMITANTVLELYTFNNKAVIWEPVIEKTKLIYYQTNDIIDTSNTHIIKQELIIPPFKDQSLKETNILNINISDLSVSVFCSSLLNWIKKFNQLKENYKEALKELNISEVNGKSNNHLIVNFTGSNITLFKRINQGSKVHKSILKNANSKKLTDLKPNEGYYLNNDDENNYEFDSLQFYKDRLKANDENIIQFKFNNESNDEEDHLMNIDKPNQKVHMMKYTDTLLKNKTAIEIDGMKYIISSVRNYGFKMVCFIYSPIILKFNISPNMKDYMNIIFLRKNLDDMIISLSDVIDYNNSYNLNTNDSSCTIGVPFNYLDGSIAFYYNPIGSKTERDAKLSHILSTRISNSCFKQEHKDIKCYEMKDFLQNKLPLMEYYISNRCFSFYLSHKSMDKTMNTQEIISLNYTKPSSSLNYLKTLKISSPYRIHNCLPGDVKLMIKTQKTESKIETVSINKNTLSYIETISLTENLNAKIVYGDFESLDFEILFDVNDILTAYDKKVSLNNLIENSNRETMNNLNCNKQKAKNVKLYNKKTHELISISLIIGQIDYGSRCLVLYNKYLLLDYSGIDDLSYISHKGNKNNTNVILKTKFKNEDNQLETFIKTDKQYNENYNVYSKYSNVYILPHDAKFLSLQIDQFQSGDFDLNAIGIPSSLIVKGLEIVINMEMQVINSKYNINTYIITISPKYLICNMLNNYNILIDNNMLKIDERNPYYFNNQSLNTIKFIEATSNKHIASNEVSLLNLTYETFKIRSDNLSFYIDIEKRLNSYTNTILILIRKSSINTAKIIIDNTKTNLKLKVYQSMTGTNQNNKVEINKRNTSDFLQTQLLYVKPNNKEIFTWNVYNYDNSIESEILIDISNKDIMSVKSESDILYIRNTNIVINMTEFEIDYKKKLTDSSYNSKYYSLILTLRDDMTIKIDIIVDQMKRIVSLNEINFCKNKLVDCSSLNSFSFNIPSVGVSLITDNSMVANKTLNFNRYEILYFIANGVRLAIDTEELIEEESIDNKKEIYYRTDYAFSFNSFEIDNQYNTITYFPIISMPSGSNAVRPFLNVFIQRLTYPNKPNRNKYLLINFLVQALSINIESELLELIVFFYNNINKNLIDNDESQLNSLNKENNIDRIYSDNSINKLSIPVFMMKDFILSSEERIFIDKLELSPLEISLSIKTNNKSSIIKKYVTKNTILNIIVSNVLNIDKTTIQLDGSEVNSLYGTSGDIIKHIISHYHECALPQYFKLFFSTDILGNPVNLLNDLKTGVFHFIRKPAEGIIKGPFGFIEGSIDGGKSLIQHTIGGTFSMASKLTAGLSKGMLNLTKDDKYIQDIEKSRLLNKPTNIVEGISSGLSCFTDGVASGVKDVFLKPVEGGKQTGITGFFGGALKGLVGLVVKPVSGIFEFISQSSEGIKQTFNVEEVQIIKVRKIRAFYARDKYFKEYDSYHSEVISLLKLKVEIFKFTDFGFYDCCEYLNSKKERNFLIFVDDGFFILDEVRFEIKTYLAYENIKQLEPIVSDNRLKIYYKYKIDSNKESSSIYFYYENTTEKKLDSTELLKVERLNKEFKMKLTEVYEKLKDAIKINYDENFIG